jgi:hypothetical protein
LRQRVSAAARALGRYPTRRSGAARTFGRVDYGPGREVPHDAHGHEEARRRLGDLRSGYFFILASDIERLQLAGKQRQTKRLRYPPSLEQLGLVPSSSSLRLTPVAIKRQLLLGKIRSDDSDALRQNNALAESLGATVVRVQDASAGRGRSCSVST